jgi:hypothetical protein
MSKQPIWLYTDFLGQKNVYAYFCNAGHSFPMSFNIKTDKRIVVYFTFLKERGQGRDIFEKFLDPGEHKFTHTLVTENSGKIWTDRPGNSRYAIVIADHSYKTKYQLMAEKIEEPHGDTYRLWRLAGVQAFVDLLSPNHLMSGKDLSFPHQPILTEDESIELERAFGKRKIFDDL